MGAKLSEIDKNRQPSKEKAGRSKKSGFFARTGRTFLWVVSWRDLAKILRGLGRPFRTFPLLWSHYRSSFIDGKRLSGADTEAELHLTMTKSRSAAFVNALFAVLTVVATFWAANLYSLIACLVVSILFVFQAVTNIYIYIVSKDKINEKS